MSTYVSSRRTNNSTFSMLLEKELYFHCRNVLLQIHAIDTPTTTIHQSWQTFLPLRHRNARATTTRERLNSHDLEIEVAVSEPILRPVVKVITGRHGSRSALRLPDRKVLREGAGAGDGWLVGAGVSADCVGAA